MSIFGQVWLWSIAAFLVGTLLTWLLLVRPVRARNRELERRLRAALADRAPEPADAPPARFFEPEPEPEPYPPLDEPEFFDGRPGPQPESLERYPRDPESLEHFLPESEPADERAGSAWFQEASDGPAEQDRNGNGSAEPPAQEFLAVSSVLEPDRELETELTSVFKVVDEKPVEENGSELTSVFKAVDDQPDEERGSERGTLFDPEGPAPAGLPGASVPDAHREPPAYAFGGDDAPGAGDESAAEATQVLPRRQPRQADHDGAPQVAPPSMRPIERREPVQPDEGGRSGSLFEPAVRPGAQATTEDPPPARARQRDSVLPAGPFGPGSATPRPGGGRPSDDFAVKASVAALRYCTEDSPHFPRMIAEVWFRTAADAEKVGFRPIA
ncbi:hypothetical protein [Amycolatopsis taiwanensis]|uniref:sunset domain-containing protein n=1 Tax=Amycolatopsis taiwanensis TaxID=342230 RepID=UPI0004842930|nr:hypothetical protein [Amycolatopsis taiwanensis]